MDWKIKYKFPKGECPPEKCKKIKTTFLKPGEKNRFKASIDYQKKSKSLTVFYYLNNEMIAKHVDVPLSKKPYIKIGIYRIGETGTTSFEYSNLTIKNKKK
jgi:signal peptidase I